MEKNYKIICFLIAIFIIILIISNFWNVETQNGRIPIHISNNYELKNEYDQYLLRLWCKDSLGCLGIRADSNILEQIIKNKIIYKGMPKKEFLCKMGEPNEGDSNFFIYYEFSICDPTNQYVDKNADKVYMWFEFYNDTLKEITDLRVVE